VLTNTFGGNRLRLGMHGNEGRVAELNHAAAALLRDEVEAAARGDSAAVDAAGGASDAAVDAAGGAIDAAGGTSDAAGRHALVAGDIGPSGAIMAPLGTLSYAEAVDVFAEQAVALIEGGVDVIWVETMSDLAEVRAAIEGVRRVAPGIPLIASMTFDTRGSTMMGVTPERAARDLLALGVDAVGGNCGNGPDELLPVIARMRAAAPDVLLVAKSNAGMPELIDMRAVYRAEPAVMATQALAMRAAGATIVGACCGSTPDHLRAMSAALTGRG